MSAFDAAPCPPAVLIAGDAARWLLPADLLAPYAPPDFSAALTLTPAAGGAPVAATITEGSGGTVAAIASAASAGMAPGRWNWALIVTEAATGDRATIDRGALQMAADPAAGGDARTPARRMLDAITARIEGRITRDADSYSIEGRSITRTPLDILIKHRARLAREVAAEEATAAGRTAGPIYRRARFSDAGT